MAYSDEQARDKMRGNENELSKRIYLNPDAESTPEIFEQILKAANEAGISLQLKMLQRATDMAAAHKASEPGRTLRGDGIVVYVDDQHANDVLEKVLSIAQDNSDAFKGRKVSRVPQKVADGIAIGDEPVKTPGKSLTSHRADILNEVARMTQESGKGGEEARQFYREQFKLICEQKGVNPYNIAFYL